MILRKAHYDLRSSGLRWYEILTDRLRDIGFYQCKAKPYIWMREKDSLYEHIAVYVNDLDIADKDPKKYNSNGPVDLSLLASRSSE